jgi:hypothetical protein
MQSARRQVGHTLLTFASFFLLARKQYTKLAQSFVYSTSKNKKYFAYDLSHKFTLQFETLGPESAQVIASAPPIIDRFVVTPRGVHEFVVISNICVA